jgi:isocitrate dehydrogenase
VDCLPPTCSFDNISGTNQHGQPNDFVPEDILASIKRNGVCLKGTLFTPLDKSTSTQSLNVQVHLGQHVYHIAWPGRQAT